MKKRYFAALTAAAVMLAAGCSGQPEKAEIKIPILEGDSSRSYKTAVAEYRDLEQYVNIPGTVGYVYADTLMTAYDTNLLEYNVKSGQKLSAGDVIAVFSSADLSYEYQNQKIVTDNAYSLYASSGSASAQLAYEQEKKRLDLVQYKIDSYTIKAPYDCVIVKAEQFTTGDSVSAGTPVCSVAKPDEVYITVDKNKEYFALGTPVNLKFGTNEVFTGKVVMPYSAGDSGSMSGKVLIKFDEGEFERASEAVGNIVNAGWATVSVKSYEKHHVLCIPKDAVMLYSGATYCYITDGSERTRIPIETGDTVDGLTVVISGLAEGDTVSY